MDEPDERPDSPWPRGFKAWVGYLAICIFAAGSVAFLFYAWVLQVLQFVAGFWSGAAIICGSALISI